MFAEYPPVWIRHLFLVIVIIPILVIIDGCGPADVVSSVPATALPDIFTPTMDVQANPTNTQPPSPSPTRLPTETPIPASPTPTAPPPTKTTRPTSTPVPLPEGVEAVSLKTSDGFDLAGFLRTPERPVAAPLAVILAHEYYSSHKTLEVLAVRLADAGFTSLSFDFRGHGDSPGFKDFSTVDVDVEAALTYLNRQGFEEIICIGASMGGTGCTVVAMDAPVVGLVSLSGSPDLDAGLSIDPQKLANLDIPKIFMIAEEDTVGPDYVSDFLELAEVASEPKDIYIYPGQAHAAGLLFETYGEEVQEIIINFVKGFAPLDAVSQTPPITNTPYPRVKNHLGVNILLLLPDQYGATYSLSKDNFELMGWNVTVAGVKDLIHPCSSFAKPRGCRSLEVDILISEITDISEYDILAIMPATQFSFSGEPYGDLLKSQETLDLIAAANAQGLVIFAPCGGTKVLAVAGVLNGKNITGTAAYKKDYEAVGANFLGQPLPPVIDQNIVTGVRSLYYHVQNSEAIATSLESSQIEYKINPTDTEESTQAQDILQEGAVWTKTIGGEYADGGRSIDETKDGGFIIAGYTYSFGAGNSDIYLVKTDALGNLIWAKTFGGAGWEYAFAVQQTRDGGYIIVGYTTSTGAGLKDVLIIKTDSQGDEIWSKTFGGLGVDVGMSVLETNDRGYILAGYTESFGAGESDVYLIRTDTNGDEIWAKTFGDAGPERGYSLDMTEDGGYIIAGASGSSSENSDVYLLKTDSQGNELWFRTVSFPDAHLNYDWGNQVQTTEDGGYIIVANTDFEEDLMDIYLVKTDSEGTVVWAQIFGKKFYDYGSSVVETQDGGYIISGATKNSSTGQNNIYIRKVDGEGSQVWTGILGTTEGSEWGSAVVETRTGDIVIVGHTDSFGAGDYDIWLMSVDGSLFMDQ